jgi:hypothetical protein
MFAVGVAVVLSTAPAFTRGFVDPEITVDPVAVLSDDLTQATVTGLITCDPANFSAKYNVNLYQPDDSSTFVGGGGSFTLDCDNTPHPYTLVVSGDFTPGSARAEANISNNGVPGGSTTVIELVAPPPPLPTTKDQCKDGGWQNFGDTFKNQGDCVSYVATKGKTGATK